MNDTINPTATSVLDTVPTCVPYADATKGSHTILRIKGTFHRLAICFTPAGEFSRREFQGPVLEGPYASTFGLSTTIHNGSREQKLVERAKEDARTVEVETGDLLRIDGITYGVRVYRNEFINLTEFTG